MTVLVPTGLEFLDRLLGGGIPRGTSVILQGPPGEEKETIAWRFLKDGWNRGEAAIVVLSSTSPRRFRERLTALGVDAKALEESGRLIVIDWFSHREETVTDVKDEGSVLKVSVDLTNVGVAISWALNRLPAATGLRAVFEVVSPALNAFNLREVFLFAQVTKAKLERRDVTALFLVEKEMHDPATLSNIQQPFDGVIDIERVREGDQIVQKIGVPAMRGVPPNAAKYVAFKPEGGHLAAHAPTAVTTASPTEVVVAGESRAADQVGRAEGPPRQLLEPSDRKPLWPTAPAPSPPEKPEAAAPPRPLRVCPTCGAALSESDQFCRNCGADFPEAWDENAARLMREVETLLAKDPRNLDALFAKGAALARVGRWEAAIGALNEVTRLEPAYPGVWILKAKVYARLGKPQMAASSRERGLELLGKERLVEFTLRGPANLPPGSGGEPGALGPTPSPAVPPKPAGGPASGFVNGLKRGALGAERGQTNGLVNGRGRTNGLVNGRGRTNGLVNGLTSARTAIADGLTNGAGFTNGLGGARFPRDIRAQRWKLAVIPIIAFALLILPLMAPEDLYGSPPIAIDGNASDWAGAIVATFSRTSGVNPNVDVLRFGTTDNGNALAFLIEVDGSALRGGDTPPTVDRFDVFVDTDRDPSTGYRVDGLGADRLIELSGWQGAVNESAVFEWNRNQDPYDWRGWYQTTPVTAAATGRGLETQVEWLALGLEKGPVFATVQARGFDGSTDTAEYALNPFGGALVVRQEPIPAATLTRPSETLLQLDIAAYGVEAELEGLTITLTGSVRSTAVGGLQIIDGTGVVVDERVLQNGRAAFRFPERRYPAGSSERLLVVAQTQSASGETLGAILASPSDVVAPNAAVTVHRLPSARDVGYVASEVLVPRIDGGFAEWISLVSDPIGDVQGGRGGDIDLGAFGAESSGNGTFFFAEVEGRLMAGTWVPEKNSLAPPPRTAIIADADRDGVPDSVDPVPLDFNNDGVPDAQSGGDVDGDGILDYGRGGPDLWLNTTIPSSFPSPYAGRDVRVYIGPVERPFRSRDDVLRVFVDVDNSTSSGYQVGGLGADRLIEVSGASGLVRSSGLFSFSGSYPGQWSWVRISDVSSALSFDYVEFAASEALLNGSRVYVEIGEALGARDAIGATSGASLAGSQPAEAVSPQSPSSFDVAPSPLSAAVRGSPAPPRVLDIPGNQVYYLRDTTHPTENDPACTTDKVADAGPRVAPVNTITLSTGQSACWYLDATTGTTIPAGDWESLLDVSVSSTYSAKVGAFNIGTGAATTTVPVTVGFQPKVVLFWWSGRTESTDTAGTANHQRGFGVAVSTTDRRAICSQSEDNVGTSNSDTAHRADEAICSLTTAGAIDGLADLSSMDANGFTLIIDDAFTNSLRIQYLALGGTSLTNAETGMFTESMTLDNQDITTVSFQPDAVILFSAGIDTDPPGIITDSRMMIGFAAGAGNPNDIIWSGDSDDAVITTQTISYHRASESIALPRSAAQDEDARGEVDAWLSNGFSLNWNEAQSKTRRIHYLALKGGNYLVGDLLTQTDTVTTIVESGFGFSPSAALFVSHNKAQTAANGIADHDELSIGAFSSTTARGAQCVIDEDNLADSDVGTAVEHDEVYCNLDTATAIEGLMGVQSVGSDGFTLVMDDADPAQSFVGYIAFGANVAYGVYLEIWDKTADSIRATIGSCLGVTATGDDRQCLLSGVASQTIASNEVVRVRVVHSGSVGTVSIDYDDTDATGDSRVTIPTGIPEFEEVVLPALATVLVPVAWQWSQRRRRSKPSRRSPGIRDPSSRSLRNRLPGIDERLPYDP